MKRKGNILLYPLSLVYGAVTAIRSFLYNSGILKRYEFEIPVICVGNITVGGTGKTPHSEYLLSILKDRFRVAILSRGYKRKSRGFRYVTPSTPVSEAGDEPLQIALRFPEITIAVDRDRVNGINTILRDKPDTEVIILDDGFQHRRVLPGFVILLTDYNRLIIKDHLLPYGDLRESRTNMYKSDIILVTKSPSNLSPMQRRIIVKEINKAAYQNLYFTTYEYLEPVPVFNAENDILVLPGINNGNLSILLVTGIANPSPLKEYLSGIAGELEHLIYPDHHSFTAKDLVTINDSLVKLKGSNKYIITTEKDAVRLREFTNIAESFKKAFYYIPIGIKFLNDDREEFENLIIDYVRKNKRNNRISAGQRI